MLSLFDVSIDYRHPQTHKRRKRGNDVYTVTIPVRARSSVSSWSAAARIFSLQHPSAKIVGIASQSISTATECDDAA